MDHGVSCTPERRTGEGPTDGDKGGTVVGSDKEFSRLQQAPTHGSLPDSSQRKPLLQGLRLKLHHQYLLGGTGHRDQEPRPEQLDLTYPHGPQTCSSRMPKRSLR